MAMSRNNDYRLMIAQDASHFLRDQLEMVIAQKTENGYRPITITLSIGDEIEWTESTVVELPKSLLPTPLAEVLLMVLRITGLAYPMVKYIVLLRLVMGSTVEICVDPENGQGRKCKKFTKHEVSGCKKGDYWPDCYHLPVKKAEEK